MEPFEWNKKFETGISNIDEQHKELFKHIDTLNVAIYNGAPKTQLKELFSFLEDYIESHFQSEENIMKINNYPDLYRHAELHSRFNVLMADYKYELDKRGSDIYMAMRLEKDLRKWWEEHILVTDMKYVPYIKIID